MRLGLRGFRCQGLTWLSLQDLICCKSSCCFVFRPKAGRSPSGSIWDIKRHKKVLKGTAFLRPCREHTYVCVYMYVYTYMHIYSLNHLADSWYLIP